MMTLEEDKRFLCLWPHYYICEPILPIREWKCGQSIDEVLLHGDNSIVESRSMPVELKSSTTELHLPVEAEEKLAIILFSGFDFLPLMRFDDI